MPSAAEIVQFSLDGNPSEVASQVNAILTDKIRDAINSRKQFVAQSIFGKKAVDDAVAEVEAKSRDNEDETANTTVVAVANTEVANTAPEQNN